MTGEELYEIHRRAGVMTSQTLPHWYTLSENAKRLWDSTAKSLLAAQFRNGLCQKPITGFTALSTRVAQ